MVVDALIVIQARFVYTINATNSYGLFLHARLGHSAYIGRVNDSGSYINQVQLTLPMFWPAKFILMRKI